MASLPSSVAVAVAQALRSTALDPRVLKALLVAGAPLRLAVAANVWVGRSLRWAADKHLDAPTAQPGHRPPLAARHSQLGGSVPSMWFDRHGLLLQEHSIRGREALA